LVSAALSVLALTYAAACGGSPTEPSVPNVQGVWRGTWSAQGCVVAGTVPPETCAFQSGAFVMRITQSESALRAAMSVCGGQMETTGEITQDGIIVLLTQEPGDRAKPASISVWDAGVNGRFMAGSLVCTVQAGSTAQDTISMAVTLDNVSLFSSDPDALF
jgi:hypothetical protein